MKDKGFLKYTANFLIKILFIFEKKFAIRGFRFGLFLQFLILKFFDSNLLDFIL